MWSLAKPLLLPGGGRKGLERLHYAGSIRPRLLHARLPGRCRRTGSQRVVTLPDRCRMRPPPADGVGDGERGDLPRLGIELNRHAAGDSGTYPESSSRRCHAASTTTSCTAPGNAPLVPAPACQSLPVKPGQAVGLVGGRNVVLGDEHASGLACRARMHDELERRRAPALARMPDTSTISDLMIGEASTSDSAPAAWVRPVTCRCEHELHDSVPSSFIELSAGGSRSWSGTARNCCERSPASGAALSSRTAARPAIPIP